MMASYPIKVKMQGKLSEHTVGTVLYIHLKTIIMGNLLYVVAVILFIAWLLGYFAFHVASGLIHILLVIAVISVILQLVRGNRGV